MKLLLDTHLLLWTAIEGIKLLTTDPLVAKYPGPVQKV
jgi:hypothetical protein